jgi:hypothetical protein
VNRADGTRGGGDVAAAPTQPCCDPSKVVGRLTSPADRGTVPRRTERPAQRRRGPQLPGLAQMGRLVTPRNHPILRPIRTIDDLWDGMPMISRVKSDTWRTMIPSAWGNRLGCGSIAYHSNMGFHAQTLENFDALDLGGSRYRATSASSTATSVPIPCDYPEGVTGRRPDEIEGFSKKEARQPSPSWLRAREARLWK